MFHQLVSRSLSRSIFCSLVCSSQLSIRQFAKMPGKSAVVLLAPGSEEMEFTISVDVLRRAGLAVTVAGVSGSEPVKCSRDVSINPDISLCDAMQRGPYDVVVLPGGLGGTEAFSASQEVGTLLKDQEKRDGHIAAICAAPLALKAHQIGVGKKVTCYPSCKGDLGSDYSFVEEKVVVDGKLITSQGPGTAFDFALRVAKEMAGEDKEKEVRSGLLL